jgi:hypothetical protein
MFERLASRFMIWSLLICLATTGAQPAVSADESSPKPPETGWGVFADPDFFPIAVWLQSPANAGRYKDAGINLYVGLWQGPTESQLAELKRYGMRVVCSQNAAGLKHKDDPTIVAWMHGDEPDNAQSLGGGKQGYGPPIPPEKIVADYEHIKTADPSRPVILNLGQGVAWDGWHGRGVRTNHPEDYPLYVKGCDIASFDIYPACHDNRQVAGKLWFVADGVTRLRKFAEDKKPVWNCIECTHVENPNAKATPQQVKAEVWMSLIRGSRGLIYFAHEFKPKFVEAGLLADAQMLAQVRAVNQQIQELARVLNSPAVDPAATVESSAADVPVECLLKRHAGAAYVFAVGMRDGKTTARFKVPGLPASATAEVLGEKRTVAVEQGAFEDTFNPWDVHLYRIAEK